MSADERVLPGEYLLLEKCVGASTERCLTGSWQLLKKEQLFWAGPTLLCFARRSGSDDVACFNVAAGGLVVWLHGWTGAGHSPLGEFENVWAWMRAAAIEEIDRWEEMWAAENQF